MFVLARWGCLEGGAQSGDFPKNVFASWEVKEAGQLREWEGLAQKGAGCRMCVGGSAHGRDDIGACMNIASVLITN